MRCSRLFRLQFLEKEVISVEIGSAGDKTLHNAARLGVIFESHRNKELDTCDRLEKHLKDKVRVLEDKETRIRELTKEVQIERASLGRKMRNLLVAAGLALPVGIAASIGAFALGVPVLGQSLFMGALASEVGLLIKRQSTGNQENVALNKGFVLENNLENTILLKGIKQRNLDEIRKTMKQIRDEDKKKLAEYLDSIDIGASDKPLQVEDEGEFISIGGFRLKKRDEA